MRHRRCAGRTLMETHRYPRRREEAMARRMGYFRVRLRGGRSNKNYFDWMNVVQADLSSATIDFASDNVRVVKISMGLEQLFSYCSRASDGPQFADDVEIVEVALANATEPELASCTTTNQRYFRGLPRREVLRRLTSRYRSEEPLASRNEYWSQDGFDDRVGGASPCAAGLGDRYRADRDLLIAPPRSRSCISELGAASSRTAVSQVARMISAGTSSDGMWS